MFHGSVPHDLRSIIGEHAQSWARDGDAYVGCSGNYTIERVLHPMGFKIHSNDVQAHSSALGWFFSTGKVPFELKAESREMVPWLEPYLDGGAGTLAVLLLGNRFLPSVERAATSKWHERSVKAYRDQFDVLHEKTVKRVTESPLRLQSYHAMDVREWLEEVVPTDKPVAMFPPFFAGDYESQFKALDTHFDWPKPEYPELNEAGKDALIEQVIDRDKWTVGLHVQREELRPFLRGMVQTTNRGVPIFIYSSGTTTRIVKPRQPVEPIPMPKIGRTDDIGDRLALHKLNAAQFSQIRSQFMSKEIKPGAPALMVAVSCDGKLIGAFAYDYDPNMGPRTIYLLSDFPVSWSKYRRLSKLIVMAAMSKEGRSLAHRVNNRVFDSLSTTAFTNNPQSAKYGRGIAGMKLTKRAPAEDGVHTYMLNYVGPMGTQTLAEVLAIWKKKHGTDMKKED